MHAKSITLHFFFNKSQDTYHVQLIMRFIGEKKNHKIHNHINIMSLNFTFFLSVIMSSSSFLFI